MRLYQNVTILRISPKSSPLAYKPKVGIPVAHAAPNSAHASLPAGP